MYCPLRAIFIQQTGTIFKLVQYIIGTNLIKFHKDWTINVASRVSFKKEQVLFNLVNYMILDTKLFYRIQFITIYNVYFLNKKSYMKYHLLVFLN